MSSNSSPLDLLRARIPLWATTVLVGLTLMIGLGGGLLGGLLINRPAPAPVACPESEAVCKEFTVFWEVWDLARDRYVEPAASKPEAMTAGAINGMLDTLGDNGHTRFLTVKELQAWEEQLRGSFEGIGAYIDVRDGQTVIVAPIEGSPAAQAGLLPGDIILAVDGATTEGWTVSELQRRVKGPKGTTVTLTVRHLNAEQSVEVKITRAQVVVPSVTWRMLPDNMALIRLASFDSDTGTELQAALRELRTQGARTIILDLRNNPGGLLDQAVMVASQFLPEGTTVLLEADRTGTRKPTVTNSGGLALDLPLVVLVNKGSASSSEIVSGAFQAAGRARLVGETTFGTGTVLTPYRLSDGSQLLLGTQQWLTPDGHQIRGQGIVPDERVALPLNVAPLSPAEAAMLDLAKLRASPDVQLARAIELASSAASR